MFLSAGPSAGDFWKDDEVGHVSLQKDPLRLKEIQIGQVLPFVVDVNLHLRRIARMKGKINIKNSLHVLSEIFPHASSRFVPPAGDL